MPTYEYKCPVIDCDNDYSETVTIAEYEARSEYPPICFQSGWHQATMRRVYGPAGFSVQGLAQDRFKYEDKISSNRQTALDQGEIELT